MSAFSRMKEMFRKATGKSRSDEPAPLEAKRQPAPPPSISTPRFAPENIAPMPGSTALSEFSPSQSARHRSDKGFDVEAARYITAADERWKDEDHYTNKSGDPRIGTHGRSHEKVDQQH